MIAFDGLTADFLALAATLFVFFIAALILAVIVMYIIDVRQTQHTIRRNYPVIGRFRYFFEKLGEFFRQYFFAMDREEMPFNRAERSWVYRAAKGENNTVAFGSTRDLSRTGTVMFANTPFPVLDENSTHPRAIEIGAGSRMPYTTSALINVSAMSYGALSAPAIRALSRGAKKAGSWLNTGEGGLSPFHLEGDCDIVFQIGTAKYGVRDAEGNLDPEKLRAIAEKPQVRMFEIKLSQGAKPGKGGILPGIKVGKEIAEIRGIPEGKDSISPNRHTDIASIGELLDMIARVRDITGKPTGFKTVLSDIGWINELCMEILKRGPESAPDFITLDGGDGGTGAAPMPLMDNVGLPLRESLPMLVDELSRSGLRERVRVIASGKLITPSEVAWALCAGANFVNTARGAMFALGCIQAMQCNKNTCPTGITTHDPDLQKGLVVGDKAERVARYLSNLTHDVCVIAHSAGLREPREFTRQHARIVGADGVSRPLNELHPLPEAHSAAD
ncbi:FMN-binding glutamate synthase family protein [Granulosicoccaceae sp. 1_MG-2023]|nr:FMN-binding glutamate synthase family protein [Granulosicoccaceae sp. 1_MG-2023]